MLIRVSTGNQPTLPVTPAMEAGISDHVWNIEEMCALLPETLSATKRIDKGLILKALGESDGHSLIRK